MWTFSYDAVGNRPQTGSDLGGGSALDDVSLTRPPFDLGQFGAHHFQGAGDEVFAIPTHICPTCAMHRSAYVIEGGKLVGQWDIVARDRMLTV